MWIKNVFDNLEVDSATLQDAWDGYDKESKRTVYSKDLQDIDKNVSRLTRRGGKKTAETVIEAANDMKNHGFYGAFGFRKISSDTLKWTRGDTEIRIFQAAFVDV